MAESLPLSSNSITIIIQKKREREGKLISLSDLYCCKKKWFVFNLFN